MKRLNNLIFKVCKVLIMIMVPVMTLVVFAQVVMRYVFKSPFIWAEEFSRYLLIWISCLGAAYALKTGMHIAVKFVYEKFNQTTKLIASLFVHLLMISFFIICVIWGFNLALAQWDQISPGLQIQMTWAYLSVPVGFVIMTLFSFELLVEDIKKMFIREKKR